MSGKPSESFEQPWGTRSSATDSGLDFGEDEGGNGSKIPLLGAARDCGAGER